MTNFEPKIVDKTNASVSTHPSPTYFLSSVIRSCGHPLFIIPLTILIFFWRMVFTDLILARGDTFLYFYPNWAFAQEALLAGRLPQWNPHIFMGAPFIANSQVGFFYPFNWPVWLLFEVPDAVKVTIVGHLIWAGWGVYLLAVRKFRLSEMAGLLAGLLFSLGGYLSAQVEHVNQLQGLAWLPWLLLVISVDGPLRAMDRLRQILLVGLIFGLQILAGHTQSLFISGVAAGVWLIVWHLPGLRTIVSRLILLGLGAASALALAAAQLLPTLELTNLSSRQGGLTLNEVLSFSLNPLLLAQSFLPFPDQSPFTEYVAFVPATALCLATVAGLALFWPLSDTDRMSNSMRLGLRLGAVLVMLGLLLALGRFNLISLFYSRLPGFNLFRVPARWLILYGLGISILAACGFDLLWGWLQRRAPLWLTLTTLPVIVLLGWGFLTPFLTGIVPVGPESPVQAPTRYGVGIVLGELGLACLLVLLYRRWPTQLLNWARAGLLMLMIGGLFVSSRILPYHNLTTREAYFDQRSPALRLLVKQGEDNLPSRFLSLSQIFFDPGDQAEIDTIYADSLTATGAYDYTIAIKLKEIVAPNLPMMRGLYAVDGFDGGVLPLRSYSEFMSRTLLDGSVTTDGRLREFLSEIPSNVWLDRLGVRFVITDKVGDSWVDGVFFDRQHQVLLQPDRPVDVGYLPLFEADQIQIIFDGTALEASVNGQPVAAQPIETEGDFAGFLWGAELEQVEVLDALSFSGAGTIQAISLVNRADETFISVVPGQYRQIYSGDVKIYENLDVLSRIILLPEGARSLAGGALIDGRVEMIEYDDGALSVLVDADQPATLLFTEVAYPGWQVDIDGEAASIIEVDQLFNAVVVPSGQHQVTFRFQSQSINRGLLLSAISGLLWLTGLVVLIMGKTDFD